MVHVIKTRSKKKGEDLLYYLYDNQYDFVKKRYVKKYLGVATEGDYQRYLQQKKISQKKFNFCRVCQKRKLESVPQYLVGKMDFCKCEN